jgi:alkylation response protein AidB-like acyl-CoA dehydrogenase
MTNPEQLERELRRQMASGAFTLPDPASGCTADRHRRLLEIGREDLQIARVAEAHTDALSILHEADRLPPADTLYGVWAAEDPSCDLQLRESTNRTDGFVLSGTKAFCTGAGIVDRALVTVRRSDVAYLLDLDVRADRVTFDACGWKTPAFAETMTSVASFDDVHVADSDIVGAPGWYLDRVGFWHGACGPAACWAGGAIGLVDHAIEAGSRKSPDPHRDAHIGALAALRWQLQVMVEAAGHEIDRDPDDVPVAMQRALMLRHNVERAATAIIDLFGRALGPRALIQDQAIVRRVSEVQLYIRQHHDEHDLESIGRDLRQQQCRGAMTR